MVQLQLLFMNTPKRICTIIYLALFLNEKFTSNDSITNIPGLTSAPINNIHIIADKMVMYGLALFVIFIKL